MEIKEYIVEEAIDAKKEKEWLEDLKSVVDNLDKNLAEDLKVMEKHLKAEPIYLEIGGEKIKFYINKAKVKKLNKLKRNFNKNSK